MLITYKYFIAKLSKQVIVTCINNESGQRTLFTHLGHEYKIYSHQTAPLRSCLIRVYFNCKQQVKASPGLDELIGYQMIPTYLLFAVCLAGSSTAGGTCHNQVCDANPNPVPSRQQPTWAQNSLQCTLLIKVPPYNCE